MRSLRRQVLTHDVDRWAAAFLSALERTRDHLADAIARLPGDVGGRASPRSRRPERLLVATDFDGCLAPIVDDPATARPLPESMEALQVADGHPGHRGRGGVRPSTGRSARCCWVRPTGSTWSAATARRPPPRTGRSRRCCRPEDAKRLGRLRLELQQITAEYRGVRLELKPTGIAVHLRAWTPTTRPR